MAFVSRAKRPSLPVALCLSLLLLFNVVVWNRLTTTRVEYEYGELFAHHHAPILHDDLVRHGLGVTGVWNDLIEEQKGKVVVQVGMTNAVQCLQAAMVGMTVYGIEPIPTTMAKIQDAVEKNVNVDIQNRIHLHEVAAGRNKGSLQFSRNTGERTRNATNALAVPMVPLDEIVQDQHIYIVQISTHGYEVPVLQGLHNSLSHQNIDYLLMEFWPRALNDCRKGTQLLRLLYMHGYTLYTTAVQAHLSAPRGWNREVYSRPLDNFAAHCQWYLDLEQVVPDDQYRMGYWSHIVAVASQVPKLSSQITKLGQVLNDKDAINR